MLREPHNDTGRTRKNRKRKTRNDFSLYAGEMLKVTWEDTAKYEETTHKELEKDLPLLFDTYGLCVSETKTALIIGCTMAIDPKDKALRDISRIPKRCIDKITILEVQL